MIQTGINKSLDKRESTGTPERVNTLREQRSNKEIRAKKREHRPPILFIYISALYK